jgi:hypothetical protein
VNGWLRKSPPPARMPKPLFRLACILIRGLGCRREDK